MTCSLSFGGEVIAEVTDIEVSPSFEKATRSTAEALDALAQGLIKVSFTINDSSGSFEKIVSQLERGIRPAAKPKLTDRQIYKTMRMRGIR